MPKFDPRVDQYILKSAEFARPVLRHLRELVHTVVPEIEETLKWGMPHFEYKGTVCSMAAFKHHCAFSFPKASLMKDPKKIFDPESAMGHFGKLTSLKDLPSDKVLISYIKEAAKLNEEGKKVKRAASSGKIVPVPEELLKALSKNKTAKMHFEEFSNSHRNEYAEWINEAKTEATKNKRIETAVEWITEGKGRNWKYQR